MPKKLICLVSFVLVLGLALTKAADAADPDILGWWKLDEGQGTTAADSSGQGHNGTINNLDGGLGPGGAAWDFDLERGSVLSFNGNDSSGTYVSVGKVIPAMTMENGFTWAFWAKQYDAFGSGGNSTIVGNRWGGTESPLQFIKFTPSMFEYYNGSHQGSIDYDDMPPGEWAHHVVVKDGTALTYYRNGEEAGANTATATIDENPLFIGGDEVSSRWQGWISDMRIYNQALTQAELLDVVKGTLPVAASGPSPADGATDVPRNVVLSWTRGELADQHDVYFGTTFDDVNDATNLDPMGPVNVYRARHGLDSYPVGETLGLGQTYYWRIDEVNAPPTSDVVFKGDVWQFTVEPVAYPVPSQNITATASSSFNASTGPENTVNGSGLDDNDLHSTEQADIWLTSMTAQPPIWIQYEFDELYKLHEMWVWNFNQVFEPVVGFGLKDVTIEYSANGTDWTQLTGVPEFAQAPGEAGYAHNTTVDLGGIAAKHIKITVNDNWGFLNQYGLSEVRFLYIPVWAREPNPYPGSANVPLDTTLAFRTGREAVRHDVYLSTDEQTVIDGAAGVTTVSQTSYGPLSLDLGQTYYWRVDEVNEAETPTMWAGDIWDFATQEYFIVEDFEGYDDYEPNRIFDTWIDGWGVLTNGATLGYPNPVFVQGEHFVETAIRHGGSQSAPLFYENAAGATYSEATRTVDAPRDWTQAGIKALTLWFYGDPNNSVTEQMYVTINGLKVLYGGDADNITRTVWQLWYIDLAELGVNLGNVTELSIGLERNGAAGGQGVVYFDDIRLSPHDRQLVTPAEPEAAGLAAHYEFEGTANDSSGNGLHGIAVGEPGFVAGKVGQAINLDGVDDYIEITGYKGVLGPSAVTVSAWIRTNSTATAGTIVGWGPNIGGQRFGFRINEGRLRMEHAGGNMQGGTTLNNGAWHHVSVTVQENATISYPEVILYLDGQDDTRPATGTAAFDLTADRDVRIGSRPASNDRFFMGQIDDVRIYDRALSQEEIAWSASRTKPFDRPF